MADASTGKLMRIFYRLRHEQPDLTKAAALHEAQLALLRGGANGKPVARGITLPGLDDTVAKPLVGTTHPFYWAPFILMGNWL